jgi:hypothetical protein
MDRPARQESPISSSKHLMRRPRPGREYCHKEISRQCDRAPWYAAINLGSIGGRGCMREH